MNKKDPKLTVLQFNECINNQDSDGLENYLTQDTKMIQGEKITHVGKKIKKSMDSIFQYVPGLQKPFHQNRITRIFSNHYWLFNVFNQSFGWSCALDGKN